MLYEVKLVLYQAYPVAKYEVSSLFPIVTEICV